MKCKHCGSEIIHAHYDYESGCIICRCGKCIISGVKPAN
jgi:hypothetical protein